MSSPRISVIIPNYNHKRYLRKRIDSVLGQTFRDFEVIILDDCSTDGSQVVIKEYADNPLVQRIELSSTNSGNPFKQWQRGVELSKGDWIWIAESDDYADPDFLECLISAIGNRQNVGLAYSDSIVVSNNLVSTETFASIKNKRFKTDRWSGNYTNYGLDEIENYILPGGTINNTSAVLFNRTILNEVNPFDISFRYIGDKYAFIKVLAVSDVVYVKDSLNYYRDPFNSKHADRFIFYFYEQFLVLNWVYKNLERIDKRKFFTTFYQMTNFPMYTNWSMEKLIILKNLSVVNIRLLIKCMIYNLQRPIFGNSFPTHDQNRQKN